MCGILGTVNLPFTDATLDRLAHRGPDGKGSVVQRVGSHLIRLGHRRLAIVDVSHAGHQPMLAPEGHPVLVFNGEIYNHQQLRQNLRHVSFRGHSDTETVLHLLAREGAAAISRLHGIFAFGLLDASRGRLFLARDPFGVKPLYYWQRGNSLVFCSELKPILELVGGTFDREALAELLRLRYLPSPDTLFAGIKKVRPGHVVEVDLSSEEIALAESSYAPLGCEPSRLTYPEALQEYGRLFERAVRRQLMADVELGVLLSGGVDSALVAQMAQKHSPYRLKGFTVGYADRDDSDEVADACRTANHLGLDHRVVRIGFDDFLDMLRRCVAIVEEPLATTSLVPMYFLAQLASSDVKVVLSGQGADELLGGYGRYQGELYARFMPPWAARMALPLARAMGVKRERVLRGLESLRGKSAPDRFLAAYSVFNPRQIQRLLGTSDRRSGERMAYWYDRLDLTANWHSAASMMSLDLRMNLADDLLLYTDKITMHHGLECRVPMLDIELVRFVEALPVEYRIRLGRTKIIHKDFARSVLPPAIVKRPKKGFQSPTERWFRQAGVLRE
ncbi:MAG: asparagine synthase (glutamine-hydrolyzing), partial [Thermoguttaceae bacterium]|nr:asparagine synthase (glutamine-hydrolyzing) [Thermoguttaceae bacterium]